MEGISNSPSAGRIDVPRRQWVQRMAKEPSRRLLAIRANEVSEGSTSKAPTSRKSCRASPNTIHRIVDAAQPEVGNVPSSTKPLETGRSNTGGFPAVFGKKSPKMVFWLRVLVTRNVGCRNGFKAS
jgi:hypothetical protein